MECKDIEWAAVLFNAIGEDWAYIDQAIKVKENIEKKESIGAAILNFLNRWRSRAPSEVGEIIQSWYEENHIKLDELSFCLVDADFNDKEKVNKIKNIYRSLLDYKSPLGKEKNRIGDTIVAKTLHILNPNLFVAWDGPIKAYYVHKMNGQEHKKMEPEEEYLEFLKKMQEYAKNLNQQNRNFVDDLNIKVKRLYQGNLEQAKNVVHHKSKSIKEDINADGKKDNHNKDNREKYDIMVEFMKNPGKTMAKYLDEYNWITITNTVKVPPKWHPDEES